MSTGAGAALGCAGDLPSVGASPPVISLVLVAGDTVHTGTITYAANADSAIPSQAAPVSPGLVSLSVSDSTGTVFPVTPVPFKPGLFQVIVPVMRGARYLLDGSVDGATVHAVTTIPDSATLVEPAGDTLRPPPGDQFDVIYRFASAGPAGFAVVVLDSVIRTFPPFFHAPDGRAQLFRQRNDSVNASVRFLAYNQDAASWLQYGTPFGNITGAAGAFGGAIGARRMLIWP